LTGGMATGLGGRVRPIVSLGLAGALLLLVPPSGTAASCEPTGVWEWIDSPNLPEAANTMRDVTGTSSTDVWTRGYSAQIQHFDGAEWQDVTPPSKFVDPYVAAIASEQRDSLWAVGSAPDVGPVTWHWDGQTWTEIVPEINPDGPASLRDVSAAAEDDVWAVGLTNIDPHGFDYRPLTLHWDGTTWVKYPAPVVDDRSTTADRVVAVDDDDAWAVGKAYLPGFGGNVAAMWHWDGVEWSMVDTPITEVPGSLTAVAASGPDDVWAAGGFEGGSRVIHWNGSSWRLTRLPGRSGDASLADVAVAPSGRAWLVGTIGPFPYELLALRWDASSWATQRTPNPGTVDSEFLAVSVLDDSVWAVGTYDRGLGDRTLVERRCV
jgi:hypothetical protein